MKCRRTERSDLQAELFKVELTRFIDPQHAMVKLADRIDWNAFEHAFASMWHDSNGRPAINTRLMVSCTTSNTPTILAMKVSAKAGSKTPSGSI